MRFPNGGGENKLYMSGKQILIGNQTRHKIDPWHVCADEFS